MNHFDIVLENSQHLFSVADYNHGSTSNSIVAVLLPKGASRNQKEQPNSCKEIEANEKLIMTVIIKGDILFNL